MNDANNASAFITPLKGKGAARKLIRAADLATEDIEQQMLALADEFRGTFRSEPFLGLALQRGKGRNYSRLLWRLYKSGWGVQRYVSLFTTDEGRYALSRLSPAIRSIATQMEPRRLELNTRIMMAMAQSRSCTDYLTALVEMEHLQIARTA